MRDERLTFYKIRGFRRTSSGRVAAVAEFLFPPGAEMTGLGQLAKIAADHLENYGRLLANPPAAAPVVAGDADDAAQLDRVAAAVKAIEGLTGKSIGELTAGQASPPSPATAEPIPTK